MNDVLSVAISTLYSLSCLGLGWLIAMPFEPRPEANAEPSDTVLNLANIATAFLMGSAVYAALLAVFGLVGAIEPTSLAISLLPGLVGLILGARRRAHVWRALGASWKALWQQPGWVIGIVLLLVLTAAGFAVAAWFTPPKGDAAAFYLVYPKIVAAAGSLLPMPGTYEAFSMIGLSAEYHFAALIALADVSAAKLFMFPVALALAALLAGLIRLCGGKTVAIVLGCAVLLSSSTVHLYVFDGKVDLLSSGFGLAASYWLFVRPETEDYRLSVLSGLFAGLATVAKFSLIPSLGASMLVLLVWRVSLLGKPLQGKVAFFRALLMTCLVMGAATLVGWLPQVLKNAVLFGAPFAPFFGGGSSSSLFEQVWFSAQATWQIVLTYPLALVFGRYPMQGGGLSFLMLCFLPLVIWGSWSFNWRTSRAGLLGLAGLAGLLAWVILRPSVIAPRYILPSLLLFVPMIVIKVERLLANRAGPAFLRLSVVGAVAAAIAASGWQLLPLPSAIAAAVAGVDRTCMMASPECAPLRALSKRATPGDRMLVATYYAYWLDASYLQCRDQYGELALATEQDDLVGWLHSRAFRFAVVDPLAFPALAEKFEEAVGPAITLLPGSDGAVRVYEINAGEASSPRCVNTVRDRWVVEETVS